MASVNPPVPARPGIISVLGDLLDGLGDVSFFALRVLRGVLRGAGSDTFVPVFYAIGVNSLPVVAVTGTFIGMVLAVQSYSQFAALGLATRLGSIINISL